MSGGARRGATPVGHLAELAETEAGAIACLRLWCAGPAAQAELWNDFARGLGPSHGRNALAALERLVELLAAHGRRPLMRHSPGCRCVGRDEAAFAQLVAAAAGGERQDALLLAALIVQPGMAPEAVDLARGFGLALCRMASTCRPPAHEVLRPHVLH